MKLLKKKKNPRRETEREQKATQTSPLNQIYMQQQDDAGGGVFVRTQHDCRGGTQVDHEQIQTLRQVRRLAGVLFEGCGFAQVSLHVHHKPKEQYYEYYITGNVELWFSVSTQKNNQPTIKTYLYKLHNRFWQDATQKKGCGEEARAGKRAPSLGAIRVFFFLFFFLIVILVRLHVLNSNQ